MFFYCWLSSNKQTFKIFGAKNCTLQTKFVITSEDVRVMTSNKDIQIDIKTKHEELIKVIKNNINELTTSILELNSTVTTQNKELNISISEKMDAHTLEVKNYQNKL